MTTSLKHHVEGLRFDQFEGARGVIADGGFVPGQAEGARQRGQRVGVVVNDQEVCHRSYSGSQVRDSSMRKVEPRPFSLSTEMRPPWSLTTDCTMARPRPVPWVLVV